MRGGSDFNIIQGRKMKGRRPMEKSWIYSNAAAIARGRRVFEVIYEGVSDSAEYTARVILSERISALSYG
jgi:ribosomal protein S19E (S16A)